MVATEAGVSTRLWIDGSLVATGGVPTPTNNGAGRMLIGGNPNSAGDGAGAYRAWNGGIDDVGMWNRVLTPQEIAGLRKEWDGTVLLVSVNGGPLETVPHAAFTQNGYTSTPAPAPFSRTPMATGSGTDAR